MKEQQVDKLAANRAGLWNQLVETTKELVFVEC